MWISRLAPLAMVLSALWTTAGWAQESEAAVEQELAGLLGRELSATAVDDNGWTDLHYAAVLNLPRLAGTLLDAGLRVDVTMKSDQEPLSDRLRAVLRSFREERFANVHRRGQTPLHLATREGSYQVAELLLDRGADMGLRDKEEDDDWSPMHYATWFGSLDVARLLLDRGARVDRRDAEGKTPLYYAATRNAEDAARLLIEHGAAKLTEAAPDATALHVAAEYDAGAVASLLIDHGAEVDARKENGWTPLHVAAEYDALQVTRRLIRAGAEIDDARTDGGVTPLHVAAGNDAERVAQVLIDSGADVWARSERGARPLTYAMWRDARATAMLFVNGVPPWDGVPGDRPLHYAARADDHEWASRLIDFGADVQAVNNFGLTPLSEAAFHGHLAVASVLLEAGADPNHQSGNVGTPLQLAAVSENPELVERLIDFGADVDLGLRPLLQHAALTNNQERAKQLIDLGVDLNTVEGINSTPLHAAASANATDVARLLLDEGAVVHVTTTDSETPLHAAASANAADVARLLLDEEAVVHVTTADGETPLHMATREGSYQVAELLLEAGADPNQRDREGNTPLHLGAHTWDLVKMLLDAGADPNLRNARDHRPADGAAYHVLPLLGEPWPSEQLVEFNRKIDDNLCRTFSKNDMARVLLRLKNTSRRFMGREVTLEEAYALLRCDQPFAANLDLIRVPIEIPMDTRGAGQKLVYWFVDEAQDKRLLGKIVSCRRDFGGGCLNVSEHIEKNMTEATERGSLLWFQAIKEFKEVLYQNIPEENLIYDREFCRLYVREPPHCSVGD